jgi:hypothetical protein
MMDEEAARTTPPATHTRDELDAAEPERPRSGAWRWLIGVVLGVVVLATSLAAAPTSLVVVVAIPLAWTWAGAGVLVGFGASGTLLIVGQWMSETGGGADWFLAWLFSMALAVGCLILGLTGMIVRVALARRGVALDEAAAFRPGRGE